jgi:hypothetical protein
MASINSDTGLNTTEFGAVVASVAHLPTSAQEHLIEFPTTFVNQSPDLDAINRAVAIVSSIALPPGMFRLRFGSLLGAQLRSFLLFWY